MRGNLAFGITSRVQCHAINRFRTRKNVSFAVDSRRKSFHLRSLSEPWQQRMITPVRSFRLHRTRLRTVISSS